MLVKLFSALTLCICIAACQPSAQEETKTFQEAEVLYQTGDYDGATQRYRAFLEQYPQSPLARTAKVRLANIDRELESVMGTGGANRPVLVKPNARVDDADVIPPAKQP